MDSCRPPVSAWLALALPELPLQLAERALDPALARTLMLVVVDGPAQHTVVACCNARALAAGVAPGMKLAAAQALASGLLAVPRDAQREADALHELACWAYQFSSRIVPFASDAHSGLLIETGASERLFGGRDALRRRVAGAIRALGYRARIAAAATPVAARLLARARACGLSPPDALSPAQLRTTLAPLPLHLLGWDEAQTARLHALGLRTIGEVLALPRAAFGRRFGAQALLDIDRLLGDRADPQPPFAPPERFRARIELPADLTDVPRLLEPLQRLLLLLEGFLRGQGTGATALLLRAHHSRRRDRPAAPTPVPLALAAPERDAKRLLQLFGERLARVRLREAAVELELQLERMAPWSPWQGGLLPPAPQAGAHGVEALHLAETLYARLGSEGVFQLQVVSDHRPERAYRVVALSPDPPRTQGLAPPPAQRPLLILPVPRPLPCPAAMPERPHYGGPLTWLAGPERIEAGWWDLGYPGRAGVHRDYFVARNRHGQTLWVYRELTAPHGWFLHGFFA
jgi:protein ImuB